jgi:HK97 gp10 family phage protein
MGKSLETIGFVELTDDLAQMAARIAGTTGGEGVIESILNEAAQPVLEAAQRMAPVKSGKLRAAIKAGKVKKRRDGAYTIKIGTTDKKSKTDAYYAPFVEFGHGGPHGPAAPHPFMRPAYDATSEQAYGIIRNRLAEEISKQGG